MCSLIIVVLLGNLSITWCLPTKTISYPHITEEAQPTWPVGETQRDLRGGMAHSGKKIVYIWAQHPNTYTSPFRACSEAMPPPPEFIDVQLDITKVKPGLWHYFYIIQHWLPSNLCKRGHTMLDFSMDYSKEAFQSLWHHKCRQCLCNCLSLPEEGDHSSTLQVQVSKNISTLIVTACNHKWSNTICIHPQVSPPTLTWFNTPAFFVWLRLYPLLLHNAITYQKVCMIMAKTIIVIIFNNIEVNVIYLGY